MNEERNSSVAAQRALDAGGDAGYLRKQATRLLVQLDSKRPRRALDLLVAKDLLDKVAAPANTDKLIAELIKAAWQWGKSCEIDGVDWGEAGDSYNQMWRDHVQEVATRLQASLLTRHEPPNVELTGVAKRSPS